MKTLLIILCGVMVALSIHMALLGQPLSLLACALLVALVAYINKVTRL